MREVGKYNLFKGLSIFTTCIPTLIVGLSYTDDIVNDSDASMSLVAIIGILFAALFLKNKIAENFKSPSAFIIATILFVSIVVIEKILLPVKFTCLTVMIVCGIDELSFKRIYKRIELLLPEKRELYKHIGFYFCKTEKLLGKVDDIEDNTVCETNDSIGDSTNE